MGGTDGGNHCCLGVSSQTLLQKPENIQFIFKTLHSFFSHQNNISCQSKKNILLHVYHSVLWKNFIYCPWCWQNYQFTLIYMYIYTQCTHQVRTESRYGIKDFFFLAPMMDCSEREEMTFPRVNRDLFMLAPSCMKIRNKYTSKVYIWWNLQNCLIFQFIISIRQQFLTFSHY